MSGTIRSGLSHLLIAAVIIHERFYCNYRYAAATSPHACAVEPTCGHSSLVLSRRTGTLFGS